MNVIIDVLLKCGCKYSCPLHDSVTIELMPLCIFELVVKHGAADGFGHTCTCGLEFDSSGAAAAASGC